MLPESLAIDDPPPSFVIDTAGAPYFVVELATEAGLLDGRLDDAARSEDRFYATWQDSELQVGTTYDLPEAIWERLKPNGSLYYRVGTTTSKTGWENYTVSIDDADVADAPHMVVRGTRDRARVSGAKYAGGHAVGAH